MLDHHHHHRQRRGRLPALLLVACLVQCLPAVQSFIGVGSRALWTPQYTGTPLRYDGLMGRRGRAKYLCQFFFWTGFCIVSFDCPSPSHPFFPMLLAAPKDTRPLRSVHVARLLAALLRLRLDRSPTKSKKVGVGSALWAGVL